jgi:integrase
LPAVRGRRDRIVAPDVAAAMLDAIGATDRVLWATALYAGLRRGELLALRWEDIDAKRGLIAVERSWDIAEQADVGPKSRVGRRRVPMAGAPADAAARAPGGVPVARRARVRVDRRAAVHP